MFEVYTEKARRVIFFARFEASNLGDDEIKPTLCFSECSGRLKHYLCG